jgi:hypothetical protein
MLLLGSDVMAQQFDAQYRAVALLEQYRASLSLLT